MNNPDIIEVPMSEGPKGQVYEKEIRPLVDQIIAIAARAKINAVTVFVLDTVKEPNGPRTAPVVCRSILPYDPNDQKGLRILLDCKQALEHGTVPMEDILTSLFGGPPSTEVS